MHRFRNVLVVLLAVVLLAVLALPALASASAVTRSYKVSGPMTVKKVEPYRVKTSFGGKTVYTKYRITTVKSGHTYYYFTSAIADPPVIEYHYGVKVKASFSDFRWCSANRFLSMAKTRDSITYINVRKVGTSTYLRGVMGITYENTSWAE